MITLRFLRHFRALLLQICGSVYSLCPPYIRGDRFRARQLAPGDLQPFFREDLPVSVWTYPHAAEGWTGSYGPALAS